MTLHTHSDAPATVSKPYFQPWLINSRAETRVTFELSNLLSLGFEFELRHLGDGGQKICVILWQRDIVFPQCNRAVLAPLRLAHSSLESTDHVFIPPLFTRIISLVKHFSKKLGLPLPVCSQLKSRVRSCLNPADEHKKGTWVKLRDGASLTLLSPVVFEFLLFCHTQGFLNF